MRYEDVSDEFLNAFVDDQLESDEKSMAFDAVEHDERLKERVCDLRSMKEMVQHAYHQPPLGKYSEAKRSRSWSPYFQALAACLVLMLGVASGWFGHAWSGSDDDRAMTRLFQATQESDFGNEPRKIIIQVSNSNPTRLKSALDETENLIESYRKDNRQLQVEIIANGSGASLLRSDVTSYANRLGLMQAKYPGLDLIVCGQTLGKLRAQGINVQLLPHTRVVSSAAQQIQERLMQGWDYVRV